MILESLPCCCMCRLFLIAETCSYSRSLLNMVRRILSISTPLALVAQCFLSFRFCFIRACLNDTADRFGEFVFPVCSEICRVSMMGVLCCEIWRRFPFMSNSCFWQLDCDFRSSLIAFLWVIWLHLKPCCIVVLDGVSVRVFRRSVCADGVSVCPVAEETSLAHVSSGSFTELGICVYRSFLRRAHLLVLGSIKTGN